MHSAMTKGNGSTAYGPPPRIVVFGATDQAIQSLARQVLCCAVGEYGVSQGDLQANDLVVV